MKSAGPAIEVYLDRLLFDASLREPAQTEALKRQLVAQGLSAELGLQVAQAIRRHVDEQLSAQQSVARSEEAPRRMR